MTTLMQNIPVKAVLSKRSLLWLAAVGILATLLALLTKAIMDDPTPSQDLRVMEWVVGWDLRGLKTFFDVVSFVTGPEPGIIYGLLGVMFLLLLGKTRPAIVFTVVGVTIGLVAILGDFTLGKIATHGPFIGQAPLAIEEIIHW